MKARSVRDLGAAVIERRLQLQLTQAQLAEQAGVTREWLNRLERGSTGASLGKVLHVLTAAGLVLEVTDAPNDERDPTIDALWGSLS